jgi:hypothetical protein
MAKLNEQKFRLDKKAQGFTDEQINQAIDTFNKKQTFLGKLVESNAIPATFATVGGITGTMVAPGPGTGVGVASGYAGGEVAEDAIRNMIGLPNQGSGIDQVAEVGGKATTYGTGAMMLAELVKMGLPLLQPGKTREKRIANLPDEKRLMDRDVLQEELLKVPEKYIMPKTQQKSRQLINQLYNKLFPTTGISQNLAPGQPAPDPTQNRNIDLNELYKQLGQFEKESRAYDLKSPEAIASKDISTTTRQLINQQAGPEIEKLNKYMENVYKAQPYVQKAKYGAMGALGAKLLWDNWNKIKGLFGGQ